MKKILAGLSFILCLMTTNVMAEGFVTTQSINAALDARAAVMRANTTTLPASPKAQIAESIVNNDTYIDVINYTDDAIIAKFSTAQPVLITTHTAARYERPNYMGLTYVELRNANNVAFWGSYVQYHDIISVYVSRGQYVVYDTHN